MRHHQKICKSKVVTQDDSQQKNVAHVADHEEEELFVATCLAANHSNDKWLIDSACTNHMTFDRDLFKDLDTSFISKVKIGNGEYIAAEEKGTVAIETLKGTKFIREVLFVPDVSQNLLSVGQLLENGFKLFFESNHCLIKNSKDEDIFRVRMKGKSFALEPLQATFKSEVAGVFWNFKNWIEKQSGCKIQTLKSDNGKEYTSATFSKYYEEAGINHQLTAPYTPQQNGVSERKNRTVMEMARLPTKAVDGKTPFEAWYGYKPSLKNLKVFGCLCFTYVPQIKRDKLDKKAEAGIFVGYSSVSKAYRIFQPNTRKIQISRDVHFMEDAKWNWEGDQAGTIPNQDSKLIKLNGDGSINKHKARLIVKGYAQIPSVDFSDTFALVARIETIRLLLAIAAQKGWKVYQLDIKSAFLNGFLEEEIYVEQPDGFVIKEQENDVYLLKKALYGLKQAPRAWCSRIDQHLMQKQFGAYE
ncbi:uncharacterized protein LOC122721479 [Manihot esculenta]|uniref:uncharacterized protein LOC122721479 n=1 Tax=Manihot esculenta TaxID=3983 RepID=UPI001CC3F91F|nr:uncharacterized protein LOC122721479 [Manihot esculenta]